MKIVYPISYMSSQLGMTVLLVGLGMGGLSNLAAEVGIVQGAALALFLSLSGNVRSLIFKTDPGASVRPLVITRLLLVIPLGVMTYVLATFTGHVQWEILLILTLRKAGEWLSEVHLCEAEKNGESTFAFRHLAVQSTLLLAALIWFYLHWVGAATMLLVWAVFPALLSLRFLYKVVAAEHGLNLSGNLLLPHLGSSTVTGITVYVFRLAILLLAGKAVAGDLYTAFAIGGMLGSVFATAIGPSLVLHEQRTGSRAFPIWLKVSLALATVVGASLYVISLQGSSMLAWTAKSDFFWQAVGLSLVGGVVMVFAQRERLRVLQGGHERDVFAPDVLVNILIVAILPFAYYVAGSNWLPGLYLLNAVLALVLYFVAMHRGAHRPAVPVQGRIPLSVWIAAFLFLPVFFQIDDGVFRNNTFNYDSGGVLTRLPIPLSVLACYGGIVLIGRFARANVALAMVFFSFVLMVLSTLITNDGDRAHEQAKLILMMQFILPMFALALGQMYEERYVHWTSIGKVSVVILWGIVPAQLLLSWWQGYLILAPNMFLFSIYQHLQYVPVILAGIYCIGLYSVWDDPRWRASVLWLAPLMGIYVVASTSMLAVGLLVLGILAFLLYERRIHVSQDASTSIVPLMALVAGGFYAAMFLYGDQSGHLMQKVRLANTTDRTKYLHYYSSSMVSGLQSLFFGHATPPDRNTFPSAHNYYLDFAYNFGILAVSAIIVLLANTIRYLYRHRAAVLASPGTVALAGVVLFLLVPDNLLKVGMREPYPGIATFFLWGLLLARLDTFRAMTDSKQRNSDDDHAT